MAPGILLSKRAKIARDQYFDLLRQRNTPDDDVGAEILEPIGTLMNSDIAGLTHLRYDGRPTDSSAYFWPDPTIALVGERMTRESLMHPVVRFYLTTGNLDVLEASDVCGGRACWRATPSFAIIREEFGITEDLTIPLAVRDGVLSAIVLGRSGHPYSARERDVAQWVQLTTQLLDSQLHLRSTILMSQARISAAPSARPHILTERELGVMDQMASGRTRHAAARQLGISARTLDRHLDNIYRKLGVSSLVAALAATRPATDVQEGEATFPSHLK
jgi:DNA-binding CsgD family transcriptional regulator